MKIMLILLLLYHAVFMIFDLNWCEWNILGLQSGAKMAFFKLVLPYK